MVEVITELEVVPGLEINPGPGVVTELEVVLEIALEVVTLPAIILEVNPVSIEVEPTTPVLEVTSGQEAFMLCVTPPT